MIVIANGLLYATAAAPTTWSGTLNISGDGQLIFASGEIGTIASGAQINLSGPQAWVADTGSVTGNTALSGLTGNMGQLQLANGATLTTSAGLDNSGNIYVDGPYGDSGGGSLTINGTLTNSAQIEIGNNGGAVGTITAQGLDNTGTIGIAGNGNVSPDVMNITEGAAPTTWSGTLNISGDGQLIFASGEIGTIASGAQINLSGPQAWVADTGSVTGNTALSGLTGNMGQLQLANGATLTTSAGLDNSGNIYVDGPYGDSGGGSLTINGTLTNSAQIEIGNNGGAVGTITAQGLDNTGTIGIAGNGNVSPDVMNITEGAAPTTWSGTLNISGDRAIDFCQWRDWHDRERSTDQSVRTTGFDSVQDR